jgi:hypothetical protein
MCSSVFLSSRRSCDTSHQVNLRIHHESLPILSQAAELNVLLTVYFLPFVLLENPDLWVSIGEKLHQICIRLYEQDANLFFYKATKTLGFICYYGSVLSYPIDLCNFFSSHVHKFN